jgi:hypothetical protein
MLQRNSTRSKPLLKSICRPYSQTQKEIGASKPDDFDYCFEKRRCSDEKTCHHVLQRIFRNHQNDLMYSNKGKLKDSLGNPKDKTNLLQKSGIYQVECDGCDSVGQAKRSLKTRFGEHHYSILLNHPDILQDMSSARKTTTKDTAYRWIT